MLRDSAAIAPCPAILTELVSDDFPVFHAAAPLLPITYASALPPPELIAAAPLLVTFATSAAQSAPRT